MKAIIRNLLAVLAGLIAGSVVNITLVNMGPTIIPPPDGVDISSLDGLRDAMALFSPSHFLFPFLGHALGTLAGGFAAAKLAASHQLKLAMTIGAFFLVGGIAMVILVGGPVWFIALDLIVAYLPMSWLGGKLAGGKRKT